MKTSDKLKIEMSKARERLAVLSGKDEATDEEKTEMRSLTAGYEDMETRYQASIVSESEEDRKAAANGDVISDGEATELFGLVTRASVGRYLERAASGRPLDGVEAELNQGLELAGGDRMPIALLLPQASEEQIRNRRPGGCSHQLERQHGAAPGGMAAQGVRGNGQPAPGCGTQER